MKIEFLLAREDHTWDTIIEEIPDAVEDCGYDVVKWFLSGIENSSGMLVFSPPFMFLPATNSISPSFTIY